MFNNRQLCIAAGAFLAATGIIFGALGAHQLEKVLDVAQLEDFETGVRYQCYHALALFAMGSSGAFHNTRAQRWACRLWVLGTIFFSGSIYILVLRHYFGWGEWTTVFGPITPIGGSLLILGWLLMVFSALRRVDQSI